MLAVHVNLLPDKSFFALLGIFIFVLMILRICVFHPLIRLFETRWAVTDGEIEKAKQIEHAADGHDAEVHREFESLREIGSQKRAALREEARRQSQELVEVAKKGSELIVARAIEKQEHLRAASSAFLEKEIPSLARAIVARIFFT